jgi:WD40 repeat protein
VQLNFYIADGEFALSGGNDSFIKLWNPYKGTEIKTYKGHNDSINDIRA